MTWLLTSHGREHYLQAPSAEHPDNVPSLSEIAHSLAHINRFTGHANRAYSVAEHSLLVMSIAKHEFAADAPGQLAALMHDAHECICGDVASPTKQVLGSVWAQFEAMHERHLRFHFGLTEIYQQHHAMVKVCDLIALATERRDLMVFDHSVNAPWSVIDSPDHRAYAWSEVDLNHADRVASTPPVWAWIFEETAGKLLNEVTGL